MFRRRPGRLDAKDASSYSRRSAVADSAWVAQDRIRSGIGGGFRGTADLFGRASYALRKRLIWPLQDRAATMGPAARTLSFGAAILLAAGAGVAGLLAATPSGPHHTTATTQVAAAPLTTEAKTASKQPAEPTLQGAAPVFKSDGAQASEVDPAKAIVRSAPAESAATTENAKASSSAPASSSSAAQSSTEGPAVDGPPAGPEAISVARDFASAFVLYETGETDSTVREAFGETATPALARALLRRPPRLPANVEVPKAKVLNVVPAPSHGSVYPISVSFLRVGLTSELRLDLEQQKGAEWRVTNVLG